MRNLQNGQIFCLRNSFLWNFKHIVNLEKIHKYNGVNLKNGYSRLEIRSPREIIKPKDYE